MSKISKDVILEEGVVLGDDVELIGSCIIGSNTIIEGHTKIINSIIGKNNLIRESYIEDSNKVGDNNSIGPYTHLRENNVIHDENIIGSYVEINNSVIGSKNRIKHLAYIGNATLGDEINVGAGVVFANYHPKKNIKSESIIEDRVAIGSNSTIISPLKIDNDSFIGAGSVVDHDIEEASLYINRGGIETYKKGYYINKEDIL